MAWRGLNDTCLRAKGLVDKMSGRGEDFYLICRWQIEVRHELAESCIVSSLLSKCKEEKPAYQASSLSRQGNHWRDYLGLSYNGYGELHGFTPVVNVLCIAAL